MRRQMKLVDEHEEGQENPSVEVAVDLKTI
jgi:hypothetical protein